MENWEGAKPIPEVRSSAFTVADGATLCTAAPIGRSQRQVESKAALQVCTGVAWNIDNSKYLRRGRAQILIDMRCDQSMVSASKIRPERVSRGDSVPVLYVHDDTVLYPTAEVEIKIGHWFQKAKAYIVCQ